MKKKLVSNDGFTLVECLVAIVIFSIMALMVSMMYSMSIQTYKLSRNIDTDIAAQEGEIAVAERYDTSSYNPETDELKFNFKGTDGSKITRTLKYEARKTASATDDSTVHLNYLVAEGVIDQFDEDDKDIEGKTGGSTIPSNVESKIYGSIGFESIEIESFGLKKDDGTEFQIMISANESPQTDVTPYRSIKINFSKLPFDSVEIIGGESEKVWVSDKILRVGAMLKAKDDPLAPEIRESYENINVTLKITTSKPIKSLNDLKTYFGEPDASSTNDKLVYKGPTFVKVDKDSDPIELPGVYAYTIKEKEAED